MICLFQLHYFLPIPFMLLYGWKSTKLDRYKNLLGFPALCFFAFATVLLKYLYELRLFYLVDPLLFFTYGVFVCMGTDILMDRGWHFPQALSVAFNLAFFNSVYWEAPIHIYTLLYRGYVDAAFPLHLLYTIPFFFVYQKTRLPKPHGRFCLAFLGGLAFSALSLLAVLTFHSPDIWSQPLPMWTSLLWFVDRVVCFTLLIWIYSHAEAMV